MKRLKLLVLVGLVACLPVIAQRTGDDSSDKPFVVNFLPTDLSFNPIVTYTTTEAQLYTGLFEGLVTYDPYSLDPLPAVAARWEVSEDGRIYRFYLRHDARFSNGDPVRAADFRETWLELLSPDNNAAYASLLDIVSGAAAYRTGGTSDPESVGIRVISDRILEVELERRGTHFLRILCHHSFVSLHATMRNSTAWDDPRAIITNGPYVVTEFTPELVVMSKNDNYWDSRRVRIPVIRAEFSNDYEGVTERFNSGEIDWVRDGFDWDLVEQRTAVVVNPMFATTYFQFSAEVPPLDNRAVRRALILALPWEAIRAEEFEVLPTDTLVPSLPQYPEIEGISGQDVEAARAELAEAGIRGEELPAISITIPGGDENERIAQLMIDSWREELGIEAVIETIPYPSYFATIEEEFMVGTVSWIGDFADPLTFLDMWTTESNLNYSGYSNAEYDGLIREAMGQTGRDRYETLSRAESLLLEDGVVLPIANMPSVNLVNLDMVDGWYPNPLDIHPFKYLAWSSGLPLPYVALGGR
jgi:oligopeptide transport system substrate-binding protein